MSKQTFKRGKLGRPQARLYLGHRSGALLALHFPLHPSHWDLCNRSWEAWNDTGSPLRLVPARLGILAPCWIHTFKVAMNPSHSLGSLVSQVGPTTFCLHTDTSGRLQHRNGVASAAKLFTIILALAGDAPPPPPLRLLEWEPGLPCLLPSLPDAKRGVAGTRHIRLCVPCKRPWAPH